MDVKYEILSSDIPKIILDLKGPEITSIEYIEKDEDEEDLNNIPLTYEILTENKYKDSLGTPLIISLDNIEKNSPEAYKKISESKSLMVRIKFITTEKCTGIQFLTKEQTYTKNIHSCLLNVKPFNVDLYSLYKTPLQLNRLIL